MNTADIVPGRHYAHRANPRSRDPFQRVEAIEVVATNRRKWKVRFLDDPYPGLVEYVRTDTIIAPWSQVKAVERYEKKLDRVREVSDRQWPGAEHPVEEAVDDVLDSTGETVDISKHGLLQAPVDAVERLTARADVEVNDFGVGFTHEGRMIAPFGTALELAIAFAAAEPGTVLRHLDSLTSQYEIQADELRIPELERDLNRWRAGWALARQWAGHDEALAAKDREIQRLREIIRKHLVDLRYEHPESYETGGLAQRLERAVRGG